jgi:hypothetical protein
LPEQGGHARRILLAIERIVAAISSSPNAFRPFA